MKLKNKTDQRKKLIIIAIIAIVLILGIVLAVGIVSDSIKKQQNTLTGIRVSSNPSKTVYYVGEEFDYSGLMLQILANSNEASYFVYDSDKEIKCTGFDSSVPNDNVVITVTYREFTTTFTVKVIEMPSSDPIITGIRLSDNFVSTYPLDWWNTYGPAFDGVKLICTYDDGSEKEVAMKSAYCYGIERNVSSAGTTSFTIKYSSNGMLVETVIVVTITN